MSVLLEKNQAQTIAYLHGEIDHHTAREIRSIIDLCIDEDKPAELVLDFGGVTFMDSSGIGLVMGRYKLVTDYNGKLRIQNTPRHMRTVMRLSGLDRLAVIDGKPQKHDRMEQEYENTQSV